MLAGAEGVHQRERPEHEALCLALEQPFRLKRGQDALIDEVLRQLRRFGTRVLWRGIRRSPDRAGRGQ